MKSPDARLCMTKQHSQRGVVQNLKVRDELMGNIRDLLGLITMLKSILRLHIDHGANVSPLFQTQICLSL